MAITINGTTGIAGVDGSASTPAVQGTDTNTGIFFPAADTIAFGEGGAEVARFNSSGQFGIGTTPSYPLDVRSASTPTLRMSRVGTAGQNVYLLFEDGTATVGTGNTTRIASDSGAMSFSTGGTSGSDTGGTERMRITSTGLLQFNSGYGSVATAYGCRAWVNFDGTGTPAIRASGNVTSITDEGTGSYTVNITNAIVDANYSAVATAQRNNAGGTSWVGLYGGTSLVQTTTTVRVNNITAAGSAEDPRAFCVAIFR